MKKVMIVLIAACTLISCTSNKHNVKLRNGSIIQATDYEDRDLKPGTVVCLDRGVSLYPNWKIDNNGRMLDTIYVETYQSSDSSNHSFIVEYRIGVIQ